MQRIELQVEWDCRGDQKEHLLKKKEGQVKSALNARFQTTVLGSIVTQMSNKELQDIMVGMLLYGKSESAWSAAHWKAQ